jgi:hypothetical protein
MRDIKKKMVLPITLISLLFSTQTYPANANNLVESVSISGGSLIPAYSSNERDYGVKNCNKKIKTINIISARVKSQKNIYFLENKIYPIKVGKKSINLKCLPDAFNLVDYKFNNFKSTNKDLILITEVFGPVVYTSKGYPLWYNLDLGAGYGFSTLDEKGVVTTLKTNMRVPENESNNSALIYKYDIINKKYLEKLIPFEKVDGEINQPLIDYHGFAEVADGYYLISYNDTIVNSNYLEKFKNLHVNYSSGGNGNDNKRALEICQKDGKVVVREPKIIKINKTGRVVWSYTIKQSNFNKPTLEILDEKGSKFRCYLDLNHPNWVSVDKAEENIIVSLRNHHIASYNIAKKELNYTLGYYPPEMINIFNIDKEKHIAIEKDPVNGSCSTHSGSINENNELILFDNRCLASETSRAVIYKIDKSGKTATFIKHYYPVKKCTLVSEQSTISCNTINMGNATHTHFDGVVVNWGERNGSKEIMSVYDSKDKKIFDLSYNKISDIIYKSYYYKENYFEVDLFKNIK